MRLLRCNKGPQQKAKCVCRMDRKIESREVLMPFVNQAGQEGEPQEGAHRAEDAKSSSEKSSSESRWVCRVNDAWRADEKSTSSDSNKGSGSGTKPETTTTGADASSSQGQRLQANSSDSDEQQSQALRTLHQQGNCNPCVFHNSRLGCDKGRACRFCHQQHQHAGGQQRPRKKTREDIKIRIEECLELEGEEVHAALQAEAIRHPYARGYATAWMGFPNPVVHCFAFYHFNCEAGICHNALEMNWFTAFATLYSLLVPISKFIKCVSMSNFYVRLHPSATDSAPRS